MWPMSPGLMIRLAAGAAIAVILGFCVWKVVHTFDQVGSLKIEKAAAVAEAKGQAHARVVETALADLTIQGATQGAAAQAHETAVAAVIRHKVPTHVHNPVAPVAAGCIPYGLVRQLDAAVLGVDPDTLALPAGSSDDACSPVTASALAEGVGSNFAIARGNAKQLDDLIADSLARAEILK